MFFSGGYVETDRHQQHHRPPPCSTEENDILRELLLDGDFASPRHPLPSSTRHLHLGKRINTNQSHHLELSLPQICFENTPLAKFTHHPPLSARSSGLFGSPLPNSIISPPRVFIQEFARLQPPYVHDHHGSTDADVQEVKHVKGVPPMLSCLPPPPLPMLTMPPLKKKSSTTRRSASTTLSSPSCSSSASTPSNTERKQLHCSYPECPNLRRSAGFCNRHSGKVCNVPSCKKSALSRGKCPEHGGGSRCKLDGCVKFAQTRGLCKSHGGGRECTVQGCDKNAHQNRLCRSHGGGKRCDFYGCTKWAQRSGYCCAHTKLGQSSNPGLPSLHTISMVTGGNSSGTPTLLSPPLMSPHHLLSLLP